MIGIIARKSLLIVFNNLVGGVLGFISLLFISWYLGAEKLGILAFGLSFFGIFSFISNLGFDSAHTKRVSEGRDLTKCLSAYILIKLLLIALMTIVSLIALFIYDSVLHKFSSDIEKKVCFIFLGYYILWALTQIAVTTFNALRKQAMAQLPNIFEHVVRTLLIVAVTITGVEFGTIYIAVAYVAGMGTMLILSFYFLQILEIPLKRPDSILLKSYGQFALPMAVITVIGAVANYLDKVMIDFFRDSEEVGLFFGVQRIIQFLTMSSMALGILLFPTISSYHKKGRTKDINTLLLKSERYLSFIIFPVVTTLVVFCFPIVRLLGEDFRNAGWLLVFLSLFGFMSTMCRPFNQLLTATGRLKRAVQISAAVLFLNITLNFLLIPDTDYVPDVIFGLTLVSGAAGAALATFFSESLRFILVRVEARRIAGYRMDKRFMATNLLASVTTGTMLYFVHYSVSLLAPWYFLLLKFLLGFGFYLMLMVVLKGFTKRDYLFFIDLLHPGKMKDYISDELKRERKE